MDTSANDEFARTTKVGMRVRARVRVYDCGPDCDHAEPAYEHCGFIHAESGELGTVVHMEDGFMPTVQFDRTQTSTCVGAGEVEVVQ